MIGIGQYLNRLRKNRSRTVKQNSRVQILRGPIYRWLFSDPSWTGMASGDCICFLADEPPGLELPGEIEACRGGSMPIARCSQNWASRHASPRLCLRGATVTKIAFDAKDDKSMTLACSLPYALRRTAGAARSHVETRRVV